MKPDDRLRLISAYMDGEATEPELAAVEALLRESDESREILDRLLALRRELRESPEGGPDVTAAVRAAIEEPRQRPAAASTKPLVAAFAAGVVLGVAFIGLMPERPAPIAAADVPERVLASQSLVTSLEADLRVVERGWHPEVTERVYDGQIVFRSPETFTVEFQDQTSYPSSEWVPNHSIRVVAEETEWSRSVAGCPTEALPECTPPEPRLEMIINREPFPVASVSALDVVVPVGGFVPAAEPALIGPGQVAGREAIGLRATAAQLSGMIEGLIGRGNWRDVHPTDPVELWLDLETLIPLAFEVYPAATPERNLWAIRQGHTTDEPGQPILVVTWENVRLNEDPSAPRPTTPEEIAAIDAGFVEDPAIGWGALHRPDVPNGMTAHRFGRVQIGAGPEVSVATWSDGRAWLKVEWTTEWTGDHLFGELGLPTRLQTIESGVGYVNDVGDRIALHGRGVDVVVSGSLPPDELLTVAESLDVVGREVPTDWVEASNSSVDEARARIPGLLVPVDPSGFAAPAVRVAADSVALSYAGPGDRSFVLTASRGSTLPPPLDADVRGVELRGGVGRYSPGRGRLEWVESGVVYDLTSTTLSLDALLTIAESLEPE